MKIRLTKNLEPFRASALARLDEIAGERLYAMTSSPVAILRARKLAEAERYLSAWIPGPLLTAEATATNTHAAILARAIASKAEAEAQDMARIEIRRQVAQAAIRSAPHPAAIEAALEGFVNG